jgi:hypothetical protein
MTAEQDKRESFVVRDCALAAIATGVQAQNLRELLDKLRTAPQGVLFYHFWGSKLRPRFDNPEYRNDFAEWAHHGLHDQRLAERLAMIDPSDFDDFEGLRREVIEVMEERLDESEHVVWSQRDRQFHFIRSQIVVFDSQTVIERPELLPAIVPQLPVGSIFYHFVDARRRTEGGEDDFRAWLGGLEDGYGPLAEQLASVNPYFLSLFDLRREIGRICAAFFDGAAS